MYLKLSLYVNTHTVYTNPQIRISFQTFLSYKRSIDIFNHEQSSILENNDRNSKHFHTRQKVLQKVLQNTKSYWGREIAQFAQTINYILRLVKLLSSTKIRRQLLEALFRPHCISFVKNGTDRCTDIGKTYCKSCQRNFA